MEINAKEYDRIARTVFAPVYPVIADQIVSCTGVTRGVCLDVGCGGGYLGAALARATGLFVYFLDPSAPMLEIADRTIIENDLGLRACTLAGNAAAISLPDGSVDLCVSRGSIFFWDALTPAFEEICRVLAPGGWAYLGGGFGTQELKESIADEMIRRNGGHDHFRDKMRRNLGPETRARFETSLTAAGITTFTILQNMDRGLWIIFQKPLPDAAAPPAAAPAPSGKDRQ